MLKPLAEDKWDFPAAAHLLNRAGFGGPPAEIEQLVALGPRRAVSHLLDYETTPDPWPNPDWAQPEPERVERLLALRQLPPEERRKVLMEERKKQQQYLLQLRGWWLQRMARGPRPFQEKMVLFWHGHFATSFAKVGDAYLMWRQNELFRRLATGDWVQLLVEAGKDPAMLVWLDQGQSRKEHPNENFAREVMELFALGEGHYTEKDITEGARALTGWGYDRANQKFVERPRLHDDGEKVIFGQRGHFTGENFIGLITQRPQAARFITAKLWQFFAGEPPSEALTTELAALFRQSNNHFKPVLRAMFQSEAFHAPSIVRNQVKSPVQWLVSSCRSLERDLPPIPVCVNLLRNLGQDLFAPPNVKGWDGGLAWITTNNLLNRYNQAMTLVAGDPAGMPLPNFPNRPAINRAIAERLRNAKLGAVELDKILTEREQTDRSALLASLERRLLQAKLAPNQERALRNYLEAQSGLDAGDILATIRFIMCTPEFQLT